MSSLIQTDLHWLQGITFDVHTREHHSLMDGHREFGGKDRGPNPKEFLLNALCGCSGMDVVSLLKKYKINYKSFDVHAEGELTSTHPKVFKSVQMKYSLTTDENIDASLFIKAVDLSMTQYCGVSAMLTQAFPVTYSLELNNAVIHQSQAQFQKLNTESNN